MEKTGAKEEVGRNYLYSPFSLSQLILFLKTLKTNLSWSIWVIKYIVYNTDAFTT